MAIFSFLERAVRGDERQGGGVFGFLNTVARGGEGEGGGVFGSVRRARDIGVSTGRGIARVPETASRSYIEAIQDVLDVTPGAPARREDEFVGGGRTDSGEPTDPIRRTLYGSEPVETYQTRQRGYEKTVGESRFRGAATPLSFLGIGTTIGLDLLPGGKGGKKVGEELIKATTAREVKKLLAKQLPDDVIERIAPAIAKTKDPNIINNIIERTTGSIRGSRPYDALQSQIEVARNAGDMETVKRLGMQIPEADRGGIVPELATTKVSVDPVTKKIIRTPVSDVPGKQRKFLDTAQEADVLSPETKQAISEIRPQTYTPKSNPELYAKAKSIVDENPDLALERVRSVTPDSVGRLDEDVAISTELLRRANAEGRFTDAAQIVDEMTEKSLQLGRGVQAYSLLGRLTPEGVLTLASRKIKNAGGKELPPELAGSLNKLTRKLGKTAEDSPERYRIIQDIGEEIGKHVPKSQVEKLWEIFGAPRSLMASTDISGMGRQGLALGTRFPKQFKSAFKNQVEYFGSTEGFKEGMARIAADPDYDLIANKMKVALTGASRKPEESFASTVLEGDIAKKLGIGHIVAASDRSYTGALTNFRHNVAKDILSDLRAAGIDPASLPEKSLKDLGWYINIFSGRGGKPGGWLEKNGAVLSQGLFSPQLWASRLRILDPTMAVKLQGPARKLYLENVGSLAAVMGSVLTVAAMAGADIETDARSSDFLKIKVGDTRYDILGGLQQNIVAAHRMISGEKKSSQTGKVVALRGEDKPYKGDNPFTVLFDLIENKESPLVATGSRLLRGEDRGGQPVNVGEEALNLVAPLSIKETVEQGIKEGMPGALRSLPGYVGVGTQTYGLQDLNLSKTQKKYTEKLQGPAKEAAERFYQYQKTGPDRDKASKQIKKALEANDIDKAVKLAQEYNQKYKSTFDEWRQQYGDYRNEEQLVKDYKSKLITDASFDRWISAIKKGSE